MNYNIENMKIVLQYVAKKSQYDYNEDEHDLRSLATYLDNNEITAGELDAVHELQALYKVPLDECAPEYYNTDCWTEIEHADTICTYDYKLFYSLDT